MLSIRIIKQLQQKYLYLLMVKVNLHQKALLMQVKHILIINFKNKLLIIQHQHQNAKLFMEVQNSKSYNAIILTLHGKCYLEINRYEESLDLLKKAYENQCQIYGDETENSIQTLTLIIILKLLYLQR